MDRNEYKQWVDDLIRKLPEVGAYVVGLPKDTRDEWFDGIFQQHELRDALAVNRHMWETGEGASRYEQHKLPGLLLRLLQEKSFARNRHEIRRRSERMGRMGLVAGESGIVIRDSVMGAVYRRVMSRMAEYRSQHGVDRTPGDVLAEFVEEEWLAMESNK